MQLISDVTIKNFLIGLICYRIDIIEKEIDKKASLSSEDSIQDLNMTIWVR